LFSRLNITTKGLILVLVPVIIEIFLASYLAFMLSETYTKLVRVQRSINSMATLTDERNELISAICVALDVTEPDLNKRINALNQVEIQTTPALLDEEHKFPELEEFRENLESFHSHTKGIISKFRNELQIRRRVDTVRTSVTDSELLPVFLEMKGLSDMTFFVEKQIGSLQPHEMERFQTQFYYWLVTGLVSSCAICIWISRAFSIDIVRRLNNITENARLISYGQPLNPVQPGSDEIADLDRVVYTTGQELQEARKRELAILDNATDVLCSVDAQLRLREVGKAATRNWGYELDELEGRALLALLTDETVDSTREGFAAIASESTEGEIENVIKCRDGSRKTFSWKVNWNASDHLYYCVAHDVSQLRALEKLKQDFLAMVSHDLRTPLNSVSIGLSMLADNRLGELPAPVQSQLVRSRNSMERLSHLVHDLLELEKLGSGKISLHPEVASAAEICGYAKEPLETLAQSAGVKLVGPTGDAAVMADVKRLTQVLINLLSNAIKFSPENSSIVLDVKAVGDFVEIGVSDSGPGIAPEHQKAIFNRFHQAGNAEQKTMKSTGLGLAIVQVIINEHGGSVGVDSVPGKGSRFWIQVPRLIDEEEAP
jgi:PAS domain S-box-containing protein